MRDVKMIDLYKKYYLDEESIKKMLPKATIVFDTSALLDMYYFSDETRAEIFAKVFVYLKDRLWIPAQVYFEYLKNKSVVANKPINSYLNLISKNEKEGDSGHVENMLSLATKIKKESINNILGQLNTLREKTQRADKHPYFEPCIYDSLESNIKEFDESVSSFITHIEEFKETYQKQIDIRIGEISSTGVDVVYEAIKQYFKIGKELSYNEMSEIAKEGSFRYEQQIPPGYMDENNKIGLQKYGDLFAWKQILNNAKTTQTNYLLIINDLKEDWFETDKETPRYELLREFNSFSNQSIWLLPMSNFLYLINNFLGSQLNKETIEDVENVLESKNVTIYTEDIISHSTQMVLTLLAPEPVYITDSITINNDIRIFDKPFLYEGETEDEYSEKYRIIVTVVGSGSYSKMLHAMTNAFEIKRFYDKNGETYKYYNFIILKHKGLTERIEEHLLKKNVKKNFSNTRIKTIICCDNGEGEFLIYKTNFSN